MLRLSARSAALALALCVATPVRPDTAATVRRIWHGQGVNLWGAPSPDGRWLSFVDAATGDLALRRADGGSPAPVARLTAAGAGEFGYFSVFDRAGERVAFAWFNSAGHYDLRIAPADPEAAGPALTSVLFSNPEVRFVQPCAWSADGGSVLALFFREDNSSQIALVDAETGAVTPLRSLHWIYPKRMDLSPDGRFVVYDNLSAPDGAERDLYLLRADGSDERRLLAGGANDESPVWSHDGGTIWFVSDRDGSPGIWSVEIREGEVTAPPRRRSTSLPRVLLMGATRAGGVFFGKRAGTSRLYAQGWDPAAGWPSSGPEPMEAEAPVSDRSLPVFSPDGEFLAFLARVGTENQGRGHRSIVLQSLRNGASAAIQARLTFVRAMQFSPDGRSLLLAGSDRRGRAGLFLHDRRTERTRPVALAGGPDVEGIPGIFGRSGRSAILVLPDSDGMAPSLVERPLSADGSDRRIAPIPAGTRTLALAASPDGGRVAVAWSRGETAPRATVAVVDSDGGPAEPILELPGGALDALAWAPGGSRLLVGTESKDGARLWLISASGETMREIPSRQDRLPGIGFSPDGKWLAYAAGRTRQEVWVLESDAAPAP